MTDRPSNIAEGVRETDPLQVAVQEYKDTYQQLFQAEIITSGDQLRAKLELFRQQQNLPAAQHLQGLNVQNQNPEMLRHLLVLSSPQLIPIRERVRNGLIAQLQRANPTEHQAIIDRVFAATRMGDIHDAYLLVDLRRERFRLESARIVPLLRNAPQDVIDRGITLVQNSETDPSAVPPQQSALGVYLSAVFEHQADLNLLIELARPGTPIEKFAELTFEKYRAFLKDQGFTDQDLEKFCPNQEWYLKLCQRAAVGSRLNTMTLINSPSLDAVNGQFGSRADRLEEEARRLLAAGDTSGAREMEGRAQAFRDLQQQVSRALVMPTPAQGIQTEDIPIAGAQDFLNRPGEAIASYPYQILRGFNWAGNKLSEFLPNPPSLKDMTVPSALFSGVKLIALASAALNLAGLGVSGYNRTSNFMRSIMNGEVRKAFDEIPKFAGDLWNSSTGAILTAGVGTAAFLFDGDTDDVDRFFHRQWDRVRSGAQYVAGTEIFAGVADHLRGAADWVKTEAGPLLERGKEGFNTYVLQNGYKLFQWMKDGAGEKWEALKVWARRVDVRLEDYQAHFEVMSGFQDELNAYFIQQNLDVTARTITVSTNNFNELLLGYINGNVDPEAPVRKPIPASELASKGFISSDAAQRLSSVEPFQPSATLARRFIERGLWWKGQKEQAERDARAAQNN